MNHLIRFIKLLVQKTKEDNAAEYAYALTYHLLLSFFPFLMFLATVFRREALRNNPFHAFAFLPSEIKDLITGTLERASAQQAKGFIPLSFVFTLVAASGGFRAILKGADRITGTLHKGNWFRHYFLSLLFVVFFSVSIGLALATIMYGQYLAGMFPQQMQGCLKLAGPAAPFLFVFLLFLAVYVFVPSPRVCFSCAWPGALLSSVIWLAGTLLFRLYVIRYARLSMVYGVLGSVFILLLWLQLTSFILLLGLETNALLLDLGYLKAKREKTRIKG